MVGSFFDRLNYFWLRGPETFYKKRIERNKSPVSRTNVPPNVLILFIGVNPNVIAVLDCPSFSHLFYIEIVEKKKFLGGDFMPSVKFAVGLRVCSYPDPIEEDHAKVRWFFFISFLFFFLFNFFLGQEDIHKFL